MTADGAAIDCPTCGNVIPVDGSACKVCGHVVADESQTAPGFAWGDSDGRPKADDGVDPSWAPPVVADSAAEEGPDRDLPAVPRPSPINAFDGAWAPPRPTTAGEPPMPPGRPTAVPSNKSTEVPPPPAPAPADTEDPFARFEPLSDAEDAPPRFELPSDTENVSPRFELPSDTEDPFAPTEPNETARPVRAAPPEVEVGTAATVTADGLLFGRSAGETSVADGPPSDLFHDRERRPNRSASADPFRGSTRRTVLIGLLAVALLGTAGWFGGRYLRNGDDGGDGTALETAADATETTLGADGTDEVDPGSPGAEQSTIDDTTAGAAEQSDDPDGDTGADNQADPGATPTTTAGAGAGDGSSTTVTTDGTGETTDQTTDGTTATTEPTTVTADPDLLFTDRDTLYGSYVAVLWSAVAGGSAGSDSIVEQRRTESTARFGDTVHAVNSDDYRSLRDGTVAVVNAGGFASALEAKQWCRSVGFGGVDDCFGVVLSDDFGPSDRGESSRVYSLDG